MKYNFQILSILLFLFATVTQSAAQEWKGLIAITSQTINLRTAPGSTYTILVSIPAGSQVEVGQCFKAGEWCVLKWNSETGYGAASYLIAKKDGVNKTVKDIYSAYWKNLLPPVKKVENKALAVYGDSTAAGAGNSSIPTQWYSLLYTGYTPDRIAYRNATGGQGIADMATGVIADEIHRDWLTIFYDRKNTGETADLWLEQIAIAVTHLQTNRFLIMPQVAYADGAEDANNQLILDEINTRIRATYPNNTFNAAEETAFLSDLSSSTTRSDGLHRNDVGQAIEANTIRAWLDNKGW